MKFFLWVFVLVCVSSGLDLFFDSLGFSRLLKYIFLLLVGIMLYIWIAVFTKRTEIITVASKAILVKKIGKWKLIKSSDGRIFINNNDWLVKRNSRDLDKILQEGHTYKIVSYSYGFGLERVILYAHEIKTPIRKKTGKKSK
ncbi:MAG: hypothetical protein R8M37_04445 [Alphaproteobacteria bacterium]|nr:hypothetical protein [Alphaproteobacteria bacterium]